MRIKLLETTFFLELHATCRISDPADSVFRLTRITGVVNDDSMTYYPPSIADVTV